MNGHAVFDLDGTLVDSVPVCADILNAMLADRGAALRLTHAQSRPHVTRGGPDMVAALLGPWCGDVGLAIGEFRERYAAEPTPPGSLYPHARQALSALGERGIGLAVCSNKPQHLCEKVLGDLQLAGFFAAVVGTGPGVPLKPDPAGLALALSRAGGSSARACYVGDSELDHELARRARVPFVMLTHGYGDYDRDWPGTVRVGGFATLAATVGNLLVGDRTPLPRFADAPG